MRGTGEDKGKREGKLDKMEDKREKRDERDS